MSLKRSGALLFFVALMISAAGDEIALIAMVFRMAEQGHSGLVAAVMIAQIAPAVLLAPIVGQLIDHHDVSRLLLIASILQGLVLVLVVVLDHLAVLVLGMFAISAIGSLAMPAVLTMLPIIAGEAVPVRSNSAVEGGRALANLGGLLLGGFLVAATGTTTPLIVDAVSFFIVAAMLPFLRVRRQVESGSGRRWQGAGEGLRHLAGQRTLRPLMFVLPITTTAVSMTNVAMVFMVRGPMHSGSTALGVLTASWAAGGVLGAYLISRYTLSKPEATVAVGATVTGVALFMWGLLPIMEVALIAAFVMGVGWSIHNVALRSAVQMRTPVRLHGRAHAAAGALVNSFFLVGFAVSGLFAANHSQAVFTVSGAITAAAAGLAVFILVVVVSTAQPPSNDRTDDHLAER